MTAAGGRGGNIGDGGGAAAAVEAGGVTAARGQVGGHFLLQLMEFESRAGGRAPAKWPNGPKGLF